MKREDITNNPEKYGISKTGEDISTISPDAATIVKEVLLSGGTLAEGNISSPDGSKTVAAINNLTAAIGDKPIVVEIDGKEITKVLYNQSMRS
jgi:hypothetical protein